MSFAQSQVRGAGRRSLIEALENPVRPPVPFMRVPSHILLRDGSRLTFNKALYVHGVHSEYKIGLRVGDSLTPGDGVPELVAVLDGGFRFTNQRSRGRSKSMYKTKGTLYVLADEDFILALPRGTIHWELDITPGPPFPTATDRVIARYHHAATLVFAGTDKAGVYLAKFEFSGEASTPSYFDRDVVIVGQSDKGGRIVISLSIGVDRGGKSRFYQEGSRSDTRRSP
jgi:hypothetical protein